MDKVRKYQDIIVDYLNGYVERISTNVENTEYQVIVDRENNHFQVLHLGWEGPQYIFAVVFHFDIKDGKIWFQRNNTEHEVVDVFMERGVPPADIVLGFRPPYARPHTGFAAA